jgi:hypothetical protein
MKSPPEQAGFSSSLKFIPYNPIETHLVIFKRTMMAKKPNYGFERKERERKKFEKKALRAAENKKARELTSEPPLQNDPNTSTSSSTD